MKCESEKAGVTTDVSVTVCTYFRPDGLTKCLRALIAQETSRRFEIVVVDNDIEESAKGIVEEFMSFAESHGVRLQYHVESVQNISLARNLAIAASTGSLIAFIDDDEWAESDWLESMCDALDEYRVDGVWGEVTPVFPPTFPERAKRYPYFRQFRNGRPSEEGVTHVWATHNTLVKRDVLLMRDGPFDPAHGRTGGSDIDLSSWLSTQGCEFVAVKRSAVYELQDMERSRFRWHVRRAFRAAYSSAVRSSHDCNVVGRTVLAFIGAGKSLLRGIAATLKNVHRPREAAWHFVVGIVHTYAMLWTLFGNNVVLYQGRARPAPSRSEGYSLISSPEE